MGGTSGLGDYLFFGGYDLSGDVGSVQNIGGGMATLPSTGINKSAHERLGGQRDGRVEFSAWFNPGPAADAAHDVLSVLPTTDEQVAYFHRLVLGNPAAALVGKQINYDGTRGDDGALSFAVNAQANGFGLEWGVQGTAGKRTDTEATAGTAIDFGADAAALEFGLQAYLQVFSFTGTSCTVAIQESSDDGADTYVDVVGGAFTAATALGTERIQTARDLAVERYLKVTTTGTFTECTFAVIICRNLTEVTF